MAFHTALVWLLSAGYIHGYTRKRLGKKSTTHQLLRRSVDSAPELEIALDNLTDGATRDAKKGNTSAHLA